MTAATATWFDGSAAPAIAPAGRPEFAPGNHPDARPRVRHLRLVPDGHRAATRTSVRLTRRGRLLLTIAVGVLLVAAALSATSYGDLPGPRVDHATTVQPGQTLSDIAAAQLPDVPLERAVVQIQLANDLNSTSVQAGQSLLIPLVR